MAQKKTKNVASKLLAPASPRFVMSCVAELEAEIAQLSERRQGAKIPRAALDFRDLEAGVQ